MCNSNDLPLSLKSDTFNALCTDFDQMLRQTLQGMVDTDQDNGEINVKVKINLTPDSAPDFTTRGQTRSITKPKFDHTVSAIIQRKDKKTGTLSGPYELVWDRESCQYVMRPIDDGQESLFDNSKPAADADNFADSHGLPAGTNVIDAEYTEVGDGPSMEERAEAYKWLQQFVDSDLRVLEAMGNYTVRDKDNRVILTSATSANAIFYASADVLAPHVGHSVVCTEGPDTVVIMCEDCDDVIFRMKDPAAVDEDQSSDDEEPEEAQGEAEDDADGLDRPEDGDFPGGDDEDPYGDSEADGEDAGDDD